MGTFEWKSFADQLHSALHDANRHDHNELKQIMEVLARICGSQLETPKFGLEAALKFAFKSPVIPIVIKEAMDVNENNARQAFHAAKIKVLKNQGITSVYLATKLKNDFARLARELNQAGLLKEAVTEILINDGIDILKILEAKSGRRSGIDK